MAIKRILTGIRPTGPLHLGHYVGALGNWVKLQDEYECFFLIADVQALTTHADDPALIEWAVRQVVLDFLAVGLDPTRENVHFELQSRVPELYELSVLFTMISGFGEILSNPTIKSEVRQYTGVGEEDKELTAAQFISAIRKMSTGFLGYPDSQAADILHVTPLPYDEENVLLVPVGEDQKPHLEHTNVIARRFNEMYGIRIFTPCTTLVGSTGKLVGTDGEAKMSKSRENAIYLSDDAETVERKVKGMYTDPEKKRKGDKGHPFECPVYDYHEAFGDKTKILDRAHECMEGRLGCVDCKRQLAKLLNEFLDPIRERRKKAEKAPIDEYLEEGTAKARKYAQATLALVHKAMHLDYPTIFG